MDTVRITTCTAKRRASALVVSARGLAADGPSDYVGRHVLATSPQLPEGVHPREQGFRILSRLARSVHDAA